MYQWSPKDTSLQIRVVALCCKTTPVVRPNDTVSCTANTSILCPLWLRLLWLFTILYISTHFWVAKRPLILKIESWQTVSITLNHCCEHSNPIFSQDTHSYDDVESNYVWLCKDHQYTICVYRSNILIVSTFSNCDLQNSKNNLDPDNSKNNLFPWHSSSPYQVWLHAPWLRRLSRQTVINILTFTVTLTTAIQS